MTRQTLMPSVPTNEKNNIKQRVSDNMERVSKA